MKQSTFVWGLACACTCLFSTFAFGQFQTVIHDGYYFSVSDDQLPWAQAVDACTGIGHKLVSIEDEDKDDLLVQLFVEKLHTNVTLKGNSWVSATEKVEGVWYWASLEKPIYHARWFIGQPDDKDNLNCVYLAVNALLYWRDANCSASMYFICEGKEPPTTNPTTLVTTTVPVTSTSPVTNSTSEGSPNSSPGLQVDQTSILISISGILLISTFKSSI